MHEFSIARSIVEVALSEAAKRDAVRVTSIRCRVGVLRQVVPEMLQRAFEIAADQSLACAATLEVDKEPVTVECRRCGARRESLDWQCHCPACESFDVRITGGNDLVITEMQLETEDEDSNVAQRVRA